MTTGSIICVMCERRRGAFGAQCVDKMMKGRVYGQMELCMVGDELQNSTWMVPNRHIREEE